MLLNKKQYEDQRRLFNKVVENIRMLQEKTKEEYDKIQEPSLSDKFLLMGKTSAFEDCYNLLRKEADILYVHENFGADEEIIGRMKLFDEGILAIEFLLDSAENKKEDIKNILLMMKSSVKNIFTILKQIKS